MIEVPSIEWFLKGNIERKKLNGYLLSPTHSQGKHKARLWSSVFGIQEEDGDLLERLIREHLDQAKPVERTAKGPIRRWELVIPDFHGPSGNSGPVLTAWALEPGKKHPHLTTAFPILNT